MLFRRFGDSARQWTLPFLAKLTLTEAMQLQVGSNGYGVLRGAVPAQYLDDVAPGMKFHLADQSEFFPSLSVSANASIPTFRGNGYLRTYDSLFTGYITKDIGWLHADFNAGMNLWQLKHPRPQQWVALALSGDLPRPFGIMAESYYFTDASPYATRDGGFLFALCHSPKPWLTLDFGGDIGYFPRTRAYSVFIGISMVPVLLW